MTRRPLLLIACSRRKAAGVRRGPAWDVYDGALYRVLKKLFREHPSTASVAEILIVSAKYGVVWADEPITTYDVRLTPALARRRGDFWAERLRQAVARQRFSAIHVNLGRDYLKVLPDLVSMFRGAPLEWTSGGIGSRCAQTRRWLLEQMKRKGLSRLPRSGRAG